MKQLARYCLASILAAGGLAGAAQADPVNLTGVTINVYHGANPNPGVSTDPTQQALPANGLPFQGLYTYSGPINFSDTSQATDYEDNFISGIGLPHVQMSEGPFALSTLFEFTFTLTSNLVGATVTHDDGISFYDVTTLSGNLIPGNSGPTVATTTALPTLMAGDIYQLWYIADNGAPSVLKLDAPAGVPEPSTWAMLFTGFGVVGYALRGRRRLAAARGIAAV